MQFIRSNIFIYMCWGIVIFFVGISMSPILAMPDMESMPDIRISFIQGVIFFILPIAFCSAIAFFGPAKSSFYNTRVAAYLNSRYGALAFETFLVRFKPDLLPGVAFLLSGLINSLITLRQSEQSEFSYILPVLSISVGIAFIIGYIILLRRKAIGVYLPPVCDGSTSESQPKPAAVIKQPIEIAIRLYWWCLPGVFILPGIMFVSVEILNIPLEFVAVLFFAVMLLAMWPVFSGRASYAFWLVAMALFMGGGIVASIIYNVFVRK